MLLALLVALAAAFVPAGPLAQRDEGVAIAVAGPGGPAAGLPRIVGDPSRPLVVLDAGHGGHDPGAVSPFGGRREKDVTLAIATAIRDALAASGRVRVAMTRENDRYLVLKDRYEIARRMRASLFISIHADAAPSNDGARGATLYTLSEVASDREAALLAEQQNRSDRIAGAALSGETGVDRILIDLAQRESMTVSAEFAALLKREASAYFPFRPEYHRFASLVVLKAPDVPSALVEMGFLSHPQDEAALNKAAHRARLATALAETVHGFLGARGPALAERG